MGVQRELIFTRDITSLSNSQDTPRQILPALPSQEDSNLVIQEINESVINSGVENEDDSDRPCDTPPPILSPITRSPEKVATGRLEAETPEKQRTSPGTSGKGCKSICKGKCPANNRCSSKNDDTPPKGKFPYRTSLPWKLH